MSTEKSDAQMVADFHMSWEDERSGSTPSPIPNPPTSGQKHAGRVRLRFLSLLPNWLAAGCPSGTSPNSSTSGPSTSRG